jgi:hypothetical protein
MGERRVGSLRCSWKRRHRDPFDAGLEASELQGLGKSRSRLGCPLLRVEGWRRIYLCVCVCDVVGKEKQETNEVFGRYLDVVGFWTNTKTGRFKIPNARR